MQRPAQLERNTRDLQESVMSIRMLPISFVFSRFPRVVRDLSGKLGKQVELKTAPAKHRARQGPDRTHRRSADPPGAQQPRSRHRGAGNADCRRQARRSARSRSRPTIRAATSSSKWATTAPDLIAQKHPAKARERGFWRSDQMSDQEVLALIFEAGFSTAEQVTDVSGRGVGMDVVKRNIRRWAAGSKSNRCSASARA
jgi:two-component system chemotaxis sensor kinase CheA